MHLKDGAGQKAFQIMKVIRTVVPVHDDTFIAFLYEVEAVRYTSIVTIHSKDYSAVDREWFKAKFNKSFWC